MENGNKLKHFVVFKEVTQLLSFPGVVLECSKNGWVDEKLRNLMQSFHRRWCRMHTNVISLTCVKQTRSDVVGVPGEHIKPANGS